MTKQFSKQFIQSQIDYYKSVIPCVNSRDNMHALGLLQYYRSLMLESQQKLNEIEKS